MVTGDDERHLAQTNPRAADLQPPTHALLCTVILQALKTIHAVLHCWGDIPAGHITMLRKGEGEVTLLTLFRACLLVLIFST